MDSKFNNLQSKVVYFDLIGGFVISLLLLSVLSSKILIVYYFGIIVALINFLIHNYTTRKWLGVRGMLLLITSLFRVLIIALLVIPIRNSMNLVFAYVIGIIFHQMIVIFSTINGKGSV